MKKTKIVALTASLALSASLVLGMTACAGGVNSLYGDAYTYTAPTMTVTTLGALDGYTVDSMDKFGVITAHKEVTTDPTDTEPAETETTYLLYDATASKQIASVTRTEYFSQNVFYRMTDGLYRLQNTSETTNKSTYTYYAKSGSVKTTDESGTQGTENGKTTVTFSDGTVLVVADDGTVNTYTLGIQPVFTPELFTEYNDVYVQSLGSSMSRVWNAEGEIVREVDLDKEMKIPAVAIPVQTWTVGNSYFEQYMVALPDDAADYDFIYGGLSGSTSASLFKMDLVTKSYNYENGKVTEHNFDGVVDSGTIRKSPYSDDGVFLSVSKIENKQLSTSATLQYYGEDGNISVDLQYLQPGADEVTVTDEYVILKSPATINVYNTDGELLGSADASAVTDASAVPFQDGYFVRSDSTTGITTVYNLEGEQVFSGKASAGYGGAYGEKVYHGIANGMIYYTITREGTETTEDDVTTVYTYSEADGDKTLGEGEIRYGGIVYLYNSSSEDYTAYIMGYTNSVAAGLASAGALTMSAGYTNDDASYTLYSYTETVTSGSGETQTTEEVTKYVFVTIA